MSLHLWEVNHSYFCSPEGYYANFLPFEYDSWQDFLDLANGKHFDCDLNFLCRWDWYLSDEEIGDDVGRDINELHLFFIHQRKGRFSSFVIKVTKENEPAIRAWMQPRWDHMKKLWEPFSGLEDVDGMDKH